MFMIDNFEGLIGILNSHVPLLSGSSSLYSEELSARWQLHLEQY
jgi:hypothetical protein